MEFHWKKDSFFLKHSLFADAGALSLNQDEKILSSHDFFSYPEQQKARKYNCVHNEAVLFVDDLTNAFDISSYI